MFCLMLLALIKPFYEGEPIELIQIQVIASFMLPDFCYQFTDPKATKLSFSLYSAVISVFINLFLTVASI